MSLAASSPTMVAIVDDEVSVRKAVSRLIHSAGMEAQVFASGSEFLDALGTGRFDCVVLDLHMAGLTGFEVQADHAFVSAQLPAIIITAHDEPGMRARCLILGASAYLRKPFDDHDLLSAIENAVGKGRTEQA